MMRIEIVCIGDELLKGRIVNTNAAFIATQLVRAGYKIAQETTLSDARDSLRRGLEEALGRADLVIATGGLGPTLDDCTREVAAALFESGFHLDAHLEAQLKKRFTESAATIRNQATVPSKATLLPNPMGSASGLFFCEEKKALILLPGVPREMELMFIQSVLPLVSARWPLAGHRHSVQLHFCLLFEGLIDPLLRELSLRHPSVEIGIYPALGTLTVVLTAPSQEELERVQEALLNQFGAYHYTAPSGKIEEALLMACVHKGCTVAFAESCSGGNMAALVTSIPGASAYFLGSLVTYSNAMKQKLLGVRSDTLERYGAVSSQTVSEMCEGLLAQSGADYAVAVSGTAGPEGGSPEKPVGTLYAAIGKRGESPSTCRLLVPGNRATMMSITSHWMLGALWRHIEKGLPPFPLIMR